MAKVYLHPESKRLIDTLAVDLSHAIILTGPEGVGLTSVAEYIAKSLSAPLSTVLPEKNEKIDLEKGVISVDSIRRLYDSTKTKTTSPRIIAIDYAERMGTQAQNAFLKLLEEPPAHTHFLLLTHTPASLLPTIRSRAQKIDIKPISLEQSNELLDSLKVLDATKRQQLLFIAGGLPAHLTTFATDEEAFSKRAAIVRDARTYVQGASYESLLLSHKYKDNREHALLLVGDAMRLLKSSLAKEADPRILTRLDALVEVYERLQRNGNIRLQLGAGVV